jgi:LytS/YehU family sensor histidine kinase
MDDWPKRIFFTLVGYLAFAAIPTWLVFQFLKILPFPELRGDETRFYQLWLIPIVITFLYATIYEGITYFTKWKEAIAEAEELEKLNLESQFRSLQSQLNPHFLFNSFNVLSSLISESPIRAERFVDELSNVYRYLLRSNEQELATVGAELRFIRSFAHLLETRHDEGISLIINVKKESYGKKLPALALQVLVENAVKHNEISPEKPLKIEIGEEGSMLFVRNNIQQKSTKPLSNQVGLTNLRQRYELLGVPGFEVRQDGQVFEVVLPVVG